MQGGVVPPQITHRPGCVWIGPAVMKRVSRVSIVAGEGLSWRRAAVLSARFHPKAWHARIAILHSQVLGVARQAHHG